jgi:chromosome segregation ATPase
MQMNFRSAFNGFNREDVVHYIEFLNSKHSADLNQLNSELDYLRTRQNEAPATPEQDEMIAQQAARIRELFDRCSALEQELEALNAKNEQLTAQLDAAQQQQHSYQSRMESELEAYRRAERTERFARERAENLYRQANGALADATVKVDDAANQVSQMTDRVMAQLSELQDAVTGSKQALRDAAATLYSIRPSIDIP